jgi:hypothetical protein
MRHPALLFTLPLLMMAAAVAPPSHAAPPQTPPPPTTPIPKVVIPKGALQAPQRIVNARRAGSETAYVSGSLALEVEVVNNSQAAFSSTLVVGTPGAGARVPVTVPANGRAWVGFNDPGLINGCEARTIPVGLEGNDDRVTVSIQPTCTFQAALWNAESQMADDRIDDSRRGKLHITNGRLTMQRLGCGYGLMGRVTIKNDGSVPATNVYLLFGGIRSNVGTVPPQPRPPYSEGSFAAPFDGRHGAYTLSLEEGGGPPIWSPQWRVNTTRSCTLAVTLQR